MLVTHSFVIFFFLFIFGVNCLEPKTVLRKDRNILMRKKRYLDFPEGSNIVFTLSLVKAVMVRKPKGYMSLLECDVPFKLPSAKDRLIKNKRTGRSAEVKLKWRSVFDRLGIDGEACVERFICEAKSIVGRNNRSMISKITETLFSQYFGVEECDLEKFQQCILPSLPEILMKILRLETYY